MSESTDIYSYNTNNELNAYNDTTCEYDANGNLIKKIVSNIITSYVYNTEDRLTQVWNGEVGTGSLIASYYYDPFGRRLWKEVSGVKTYYHYADEGLIGEYDADGNEIKTYGYRPGSTWGTDPLFMKVGTEYYFYHNDHLGTPQKMTGVNSAVVWSAKYESFGKADVDAGSTVENNLRFPGQYWDEETGLRYNYFRYYDPTIGRYLRIDPIRLDLLLFGSAGLELLNLGSKNPYNYVENDPINLNDPLGLIKCECGKESYYDKGVFITCMINATIGLELIGPSISIMKKYNKRQFYRIAKKFGKKWGARIVPGIGWLITGVDFINNLGKCHQKAQRCL